MNEKLTELYHYLSETPFEKLQWKILDKLNSAIFLDDDFDDLPDDVDTVMLLLDYDVLDNWDTTAKITLKADLVEIRHVLQKYLSREMS